MMAKRGLRVSYESLRRWCKKFARPLTQQLRKKEVRRSDKWHLDEMTGTVAKNYSEFQKGYFLVLATLELSS
nr:hypothetical protein [Piscirickettsia salmonis]